MPTAPTVSNDQQLVALAKANRIRSRRAQMKRDLRGGLAPGPLVEQPPEWLATMKVFAYLDALPRVGKVKAARILRDCMISQAKTVGGLSSRQRAALVAVLDARGGDLLDALAPSRRGAVQAVSGPHTPSEQASAA